MATALAKQLRADFGSEMASMLGLKPLKERDRAWRGLEEKLEASMRSTMPPPHRRAAMGAADAATITESTVRESTDARTFEPAAPKKPLWWALAAAVGVLLVAGGVAAAVILSRAPAGSGPRYVVIEKNTVPTDPTAKAGGTNPPTTPAATATAQGTIAAQSAGPNEQKPPDGGKTPASGTDHSGQPNTAALSRAVQRQGGAIQGCFQKYVAKVGGTPQVTISFRIDPAGSVTSASLAPAALAGTPLGGCILSIARRTSFPPQGTPVAFSIPITARVSR